MEWTSVAGDAIGGCYVCMLTFLESRLWCLRMNVPAALMDDVDCAQKRFSLFRGTFWCTYHMRAFYQQRTCPAVTSVAVAGRATEACALRMYGCQRPDTEGVAGSHALHRQVCLRQQEIHRCLWVQSIVLSQRTNILIHQSRERNRKGALTCALEDVVQHDGGASGGGEGSADGLGLADRRDEVEERHGRCGFDREEREREKKERLEKVWCV